MKQNIKRSLTFLSFSSFLLSITPLQAFDLDTALKETTQILHSQSSENDTMIEKLHQYGITVFTTWDSFMPQNAIRRDEAAKMLTITKQFFTPTKGEKSKNQNCEFSDLNEAWDDLKDLIKTSCYEGLFHGHQGKFMPQKFITNGEILTVIGRILYGMLDETNGHFAKNYAENLEKNHLLENTNLSDASTRDSPATRGDLAIIIGNIISQ
ncbi:hypothetical protein IJM86_01360 [bacterium]|nr:hypothetical protein [bacterium]